METDCGIQDHENRKSVIFLDGDENESAPTFGEEVNENSSPSAFIEGLEKTLLEQDIANEEEVYRLYCDYAHALGFSVRKEKYCYRYGTKIVKAMMFYYSKEGVKDEKAGTTTEFAYNRLEVRTGCKRMIYFSVLESRRWKVTNFVKEHNHEMAQSYERHLLRSARKISDVQKSMVDSMVNAGLRTVNAYSYLCEEGGGGEYLGFAKKDMYNYVNTQRNSLIEAGDAQSCKLFQKQG